MTRANIEEITKDPAHWIRKAREGETVLITEADNPVAEIRPVEPVAHGSRPIGLGQGDFVVPDDFDDPLPEEIQRLFEGECES